MADLPRFRKSPKGNEMKTLTTTLYTFDELPADIQNKVIENLRHVNTEDCEWYDFVYEVWKEKLEAKGFIDAKINFSGFWCQGDGACFDCLEFDADKLFTSLEYNEVEKAAAMACAPSFEIHTINHHYSHERARAMNVSWNDGWDCLDEKGIAAVFDAKTEDLPLLINEELTEDARDLLQLRLQTGLGSDYASLEEFQMAVQTDLETLRLSLSKEIYHDLQEEYEYITSDESIKETITVNEWHFTESGKPEWKIS